MSKRENELQQFIVIPPSPAEQAQLRALSARDLGRRMRAWIQAQNVLDQALRKRKQ